MEKTKYVGLHFWDALTIVFITLKLCHVIEWSWVWVLSPQWITLCVLIVIVTIVEITENI